MPSVPAGDDDRAPLAKVDRRSWNSFHDLLDLIAQQQSDGGEATQLPSDTDAALVRFDGEVERIAKVVRMRAASPNEFAFVEESFTYPTLRGAIFVGHVNTDLDSIAGAIGAAELFDGVACRSEDNLNGEIVYALEQVAGIEAPPLFDTTPGAGTPDPGTGKLKKVCLVDHNETKQMHPVLRDDPRRSERIVGLIDHHAMSESFSSAGPLSIDVRPWGSMSSIVTHMFMRLSVEIRPPIARILMCAVLSDTLNLQSVTTTHADRFAVALLAKLGGIAKPDAVARQMFRHKTKWIVSLGPYAMVRGDQKDFAVDGWKFGISVLEVTDVAPVLAIADNLLLELRLLKKEKGHGQVTKQLDFAFLFVVDVVNQNSKLLICGGREYALASKAFPQGTFSVAKEGLKAPGTTVSADQTLCDVGGLVSRKAQFVPAFSRVLGQQGGFECHRTRVTDPMYSQGKSGKLLDDVIARGRAGVHYSADGTEILRRDSMDGAAALFEQKDMEG